MKILAQLRSFVLALVRRTHFRDEIDEELQAHIQDRAVDLERSGLSRAEAEGRARLEFGGYEKFKEECQEARGTEWTESLLKDVRYSFRMQRKSPLFTAVVVFTLALGIGAATAIFSVVDTVMLRSEGFSRPGEIVTVDENGPGGYEEGDGVSARDFSEWQTQATVFSGMAAYQSWEFHALSGGGDEPDEVWASPVTWNLFQVLGANVLFGRTFAPNETQTVILSHHYWRTHFKADRKIVGKSIALDGKLAWIIGVARPDFEFPAPNAQMWTPLVFNPAEQTNRNLHVVARLNAGTAIQQAQTVMSTVVTRLAAQQPKTKSGWIASVTPLKASGIQGTLRDTIFALSGAVVFMLMIVCANVVSMLLARSMTRQGEIAVRAALGAGRARLIQQMVIESVLLTLAGGVFGVVLAHAGLAAIIRLIPKYSLIETQALNHISIELPVLGIMAALSLAIGVGVGLLPALKAARIDVDQWLREHGRVVAGGGTRLQSTLVVCEIALALVLLVGAGLMLRSFRRLSTTPTGFEPDHLLTVRVPLMNYKYSPAQSADFYRDVLGRIRAIPDVKAAGMANNLPFTGFHVSLYVPPPPNASGGDSNGVAGRSVSPGYFQAMGTSFVAGRDFTESENRAGAPCVRIVNQTMARLYWPGKEAVGQPLRRVCPNDGTATVVGVVADSKQESVGAAAQPELYQPYAQHPFASFLVNFAIRTTADPLNVASAVRDAIRQIDDDQPVIQLRTMNEVIAESVWREHVCASVLSILSAIALVLSSVGIYGVVAYSMSQRTHELGVRAALGATRRNVFGLVFRQGLLVTLVGLFVGFALSLGLTRTLRSLLFGVTPTDAVTFAAVIVLLFMTAMAACYIPARRAANVDPMAALRHE